MVFVLSIGLIFQKIFIEVSDNIQPLTKCGDLMDWSFLVNTSASPLITQGMDTRGMTRMLITSFIYQMSSLY